eukprot:SAG22_NODE_10187_length_548_cov_1.365256_1_plen_92_part_10
MLYDFDTARLRLEELEHNVEPTAAVAIEGATGSSAAEVGQALSQIIPQIISKPLGMRGDKDELDTQMGEIERVLRVGSAPVSRLAGRRSAVD